MKYLVALCFLLASHHANSACNAHSDDPVLDQLCGVNVPINDPIYYTNDDKETVILYRVWNSKYPQSRLGRFWSMTRPSGSKDLYRRANAICPEWSDLTDVVQCEVAPGAEFIVGTTQAVQCNNTAYLSNDTIQVFVPNAQKDMINCVDVEWKQ